MAGAVKAVAQTDAETDGAEGDGEQPAAPAKAGLVKKLLVFVNPLALLKLPRKLQFIVGGAVLLLAAGAGAALYFLPGADEHAEADGTHAEEAPPPPAHAVFYDVPDIIVNIQTQDAAPAYLKLSVALELEDEEAKVAVEPVTPRVVDQFQTYLRELRVEDIRGSAGVMRLKEELLRRVNLAIAPTHARDVLLKEIIVQ